MIDIKDVFRIGVLGKTHGVNGEMNFTFEDDVFDRVNADYIILMLDGILVPFFIEEYRFRSDERALIKLEGIDSAERAREFVGTEVFFPYALTDGQREEMLRWTNFIGYMIEDIGHIDSVDETTENVLFEVKRKDNTKILIPAVEEWIKDINHEERKIIMTVPKGLFEI